MSNLIVKKQEELPDNLRYLTGKEFDLKEHLDILYVEGFYNVQNIAKISFYISLAILIFSGIFFLSATIPALLDWRKTSNLLNEGNFITGMMLLFSLGFFLICRGYLKRTTILQKKIETGEKRLGLWITPTHLISVDTNEGLKGVEIKEIDHLDIYRSVRPPIDMVIVHLHNKEEIRIVADWLKGYYKKPEELKTLIESIVFNKN